MRVCGEELLANPEMVLPKIAKWLGLRSDTIAIDCMKHPEKWPFASVGPRNARFGNDPNFCQKPTLQVNQRKQQRLDGALPWRPDAAGIKPEVRRLAEKFGYE
jgi:hypothetical protein